MIELNEKKEFNIIKKENINLVETNKMLIKEIKAKNVGSKAMIQKNIFKSVNENQKLSIINENDEKPLLIGLKNIGAICFMNSYCNA